MRPSDVLLVAAADRRRERWRNGLGWTTELARSPAAGRWDWRLSIAESDDPAPFSTFAGVDRHLVLLGGGGLRLRFDDGEVATLERAGDGHRFAGERSIVGEPVSGPTRQLNLMWRRDRLDAVVLAADPVVPSDVAVHPEEGGGVRVEFLDADVGVVCRLTPRGPVRS